MDAYVCRGQAPIVGAVDGVTEGTQLGNDVGLVGNTVGTLVGTVGPELGNADGNDVGIVDGRDEGCAVEHTNDDPEPDCKYPTEHVL